MSDSEDREKRLEALRSRVRDELVDDGVIEVDEEVEIEVRQTESLSDRISRRRRRMVRTREERRKKAREAVARGEHISIVGLPAALRERAEESWVLNLAVLLIIVGSVLGAASGALLISTDPRDLVSSSLFEGEQNTELRGLVMSELDTENATGGDAVEGVEVDLIRLSDNISQARTQTNEYGRFTLLDLPRVPMKLRLTYENSVTIERLLVPGENNDLTLTLKSGDGVDSADLRGASHLASAIQLSTAIAVITLIAAAIGLVGAMEARRGAHYRRTQWLCGLGLFSRGTIFFGPLLILMGMALLMVARNQFDDQT